MGAAAMMPRRSWSADPGLAAAVFLATALYVAARPHNLGESDEGLLLYESVRMLHGEVYLREVFDIVPPGAQVVFVAAFALFGASITTARLAMAVVHGLIALTAYAAARRLGVRPSLAAAAGVAHVALAQPAFPYASPHWLGSLLIIVLLWLGLGRPWAARARGAAWLGLVVGALTTLHHAKAVVFGPCVALLLLADHLCDRRYGAAAGWGRLARQVAWAAAGALALVVPCAVALVATAGVQPVYAALVEFPLVHYRQAVHTSWGGASPLVQHLAAYTWPPLLAALPIALLPAGGRALHHLVRGDAADAVRAHAALVIVAAGAVASIWYYPDFIHVAFIAPLFFVACADALDWALRRAGAWEVRLAPATAAVVLALLVAWAARNLLRVRDEYAVPVETAFGRVDVRSADAARLIDTVRRLVGADPARRLFVYPAYPALYLMAGAHNPTRFQILVPAYNPPAAFDEAIAALQRRRTPLVVVLEPMVPANDRLLAHVRTHYERDTLPGLDGLGIYRRRS